MLQTEHMHTLLAVVDEGSFEAAARRLHITPSAVSQRIKALEQSAGRVLVERSLPARTTEAGAAVLRFARQLDLLARDLDADLERDDETAPAVVAVAVNADSLATWFLPALARAHAELGTAFEVLREDQGHTAELLRSGAVAAAVTSTDRPVQGCTSTRLGVMRYRAVATPSFRDRWMPDSRIASLGPAPFVDFDRKDALQQAFLRRVGRTSATGPRHLIPTSADFARAIRLGLGWGLLPDQQCDDDLGSGALVELAPEHPVDVPLFWQRWNLRSRALDGVTAIVAAAAAAELVQT